MRTKRSIALLLCLFLIMMSFSGCSGNSVSGTWKMCELEYGNQSYSANELAAIPADNPISFYSGWSKSTIRFTDSGNFVLKVPGLEIGTMTELKGSYTLGDGYIEFINPDDPSDFAILELVDDELFYQISDNVIIVFSK